MTMNSITIENGSDTSVASLQLSEGLTILPVDSTHFNSATIPVTTGVSVERTRKGVVRVLLRASARSAAAPVSDCCCGEKQKAPSDVTVHTVVTLPKDVDIVSDNPGLANRVLIGILGTAVKAMLNSLLGNDNSTGSTDGTTFTRNSEGVLVPQGKTGANVAAPLLAIAYEHDETVASQMTAASASVLHLSY